MIVVVLVKVTRNRQITIPNKIAKKLGIKEGDYVEIVFRNNELIIRKVKGLDELAGSWRHVDAEKILKILEKRWRNWSST